MVRLCKQGNQEYEVGDTISFNTIAGSYIGVIKEHEYKHMSYRHNHMDHMYYLSIVQINNEVIPAGTSNHVPFKSLNIIDWKNSINRDGAWPYTNTISELLDIINVLETITVIGKVPNETLVNNNYPIW